MSLYITPLSAHPPGVITGLVVGNSYRIFTLVTKAVDRKGHFHNFYNRLLHRGYQPATIKPVFQRAVVQQQTRLIAQQNSPQPSLPPTNTHLELVYYHVQYHLQDPPSRDIQLLWRDKFSEPKYEKKFKDIVNKSGKKTNLSCFIVAYSHPPNLGNILSSKNLADHPGNPLFIIFMIRDVRGASGKREREK